MTDNELLKKFEEQSLPHKLWNHATHLRVCFLYLAKFHWQEALQRMKDGIKLYNAEVSKQIELKVGYHETLTTAWMWLIFTAKNSTTANTNFFKFLEENPMFKDTTHIFSYYTESLIFSPLAREEFIAPDRKPLPDLKSNNFSTTFFL